MNGLCEDNDKGIKCAKKRSIRYVKVHLANYSWLDCCTFFLQKYGEFWLCASAGYDLSPRITMHRKCIKWKYYLNLFLSFLQHYFFLFASFVLCYYYDYIFQLSRFQLCLAMQYRNYIKIQLSRDTTRREWEKCRPFSLSLLLPLLLPLLLLCVYVCFDALVHLYLSAIRLKARSTKANNSYSFEFIRHTRRYTHAHIHYNKIITIIEMKQKKGISVMPNNWEN